MENLIIDTVFRFGKAVGIGLISGLVGYVKNMTDPKKKKWDWKKATPIILAGIGVTLATEYGFDFDSTEFQILASILINNLWTATKKYLEMKK